MQRGGEGMGPRMPPGELGRALGPAGARVTLAAFLDYTCPFSRKAFRTLVDEVAPHYAASGNLRIVFHPQIQPWHPQSAILHEAALAVARAGGDEKFWAFSAALFDKPQYFYDINTLHLSRAEMYRKLSDLAEQTCGGSLQAADVWKLLALKPRGEPGSPGELNVGNSVTEELKWAVKYSRKRGIHVSPTTLLNGIEFDSSSSWTLAEWCAALDPYVL